MRDTTARSTTPAGATTEFAPDVMTLLLAALRRAVRAESATVGTDTVLGELVSGDTDAGTALAPGMRASGSLAGLIRAHAGQHWACDDETGTHPGAGGAAQDRRDDEQETDATWRETRWRFTFGTRDSGRDPGRELPGMTGALRACLLLALRTARAEGAHSVRCRHVARALLELPGTRAREAMTLERLDLTAAATALDALDARDRADTGTGGTDTEHPESGGVTLLRRAGMFGRGGNRLTRAFASWTAGSTVNGSPVVMAVSTEAVRQAVRSGRTAAAPVDLMLGVLALDRAMRLAGHAFPEPLADVNSGAELLHRAGVRQVSLVAAARSVPPGAVPEGELELLSGAADHIVSVARLLAAECGSPTVGTVHLLAALLDDERPPRPQDPAGDGIAVLLGSLGVDVPALRADLGRHRAA
ncbi:Clp protease N-terminal domain-containing protein [Streptomyces sp. NPDC048290]|uniref:Clp protease N-terminal domain-containing protein n=1 Tax=Streptomyces sp. NPDC048290 TaxID=3155811 RepID=UPI003420B874